MTTTLLVHSPKELSPSNPSEESGDPKFASNDSMASDSSNSTISNPEDPQLSPDSTESVDTKRPLFRLSTQTSTEEEDIEGQPIRRIRNSNSRDMADLPSSYASDSHWINQASRGRSDSWSHRTRVTAAVAAARLASFKKSATQTNLFNGSADDLTQQQVITNRRLFNISNGSSINTSMELLEQHPTPPAVTTLAESVAVVSVAKHVHTELILAKHSLKTQLTKCQRLLDAYFGFLVAPALGATIDEKVSSIGFLGHSPCFIVYF